jgi:hypothetical protein
MLYGEVQNDAGVHFGVNLQSAQILTHTPFPVI